MKKSLKSENVVAKKVNAVVDQNMGTQLKTTANEIVGDLKEMGQDLKVAATKSTKEIAAAIDFKDSVSKVKETSQTLNSQLKETAQVLVGEMKEVGADLKNVVTTNFKEVAQKIDLTENVDKVKEMAKNMNTEILNKTTEMVSDIKEKGTALKTSTQKLAKDAMDNIKINDRVKAIKTAVINSNEMALESAENLIEGLEANSVKWNKLATKAINGGLKMVERNQDLVFTTLEGVKTQMTGTVVRFKKLIKA